jgi:hypothetical protein
LKAASPLDFAEIYLLFEVEIKQRGSFGRRRSDAREKRAPGFGARNCKQPSAP